MINNLIDEARYFQYVAARKDSPDITPESWEKVFGKDVYEWEKRFQLEKNDL